MFSLSYGDAGFSKDDFFAPSSGLKLDTDFLDHAIGEGLPFFFHWNINEDGDSETYLCRTAGVQMPLKGTVARRELRTRFEAYREVS